MRRSATLLWIVIAVVCALGLGASGYLNFVQYQRDQEVQRQLNGTITDLRYQLSVDAKATPSPTATPTPSTSPSIATTPTVLAAQTVAFTQLAVAISVTAPLSDLTYQYQQVSGQPVANLTTTSLIHAGTTCGPGALGQLVKRPLISRLTTGTLVKRIGSFNYYFVAPVRACAKDPATTSMLAADRAALPAALATLTSHP